MSRVGVAKWAAGLFVLWVVLAVVYCVGYWDGVRRESNGTLFFVAAGAAQALLVMLVGLWRVAGHRS
jgi:hypothetical protein